MRPLLRDPSYKARPGTSLRGPVMIGAEPLVGIKGH